MVDLQEDNIYPGPECYHLPQRTMTGCPRHWAREHHKAAEFIVTKDRTKLLEYHLRSE